MINWTINAYDLLAIIGAALMLYGRIISLETKMSAVWEDYTQRRRQSKHQA